MHGDLSIKIIGVGGGGMSAASGLVDRVQNAVCIAMDTDESALLSAKAHEKILLGKSVTRSASAGGDAEIAAKVLQADIDLIKNSVSASDIVFITASLGGNVSLAAVSVILCGFIGAVFGPLFIRMFHIGTSVGKGLALGCCSHGLGTSKAIEMGAVEGAVSGLAIALMGIMTALVVPLFNLIFPLQ